MGKIKILKCPIEGLYVIEPMVYEDARGYFMEMFNQKYISEAGLNTKFVQDNQSFSMKGVLRGLHFQKKHPQIKLIQVIEGAIFDVAVDIRTNSVTYGKGFGIKLSEKNKKQFYISEGFAHGFLVTSEKAKLLYKCSDFYHPDDECGVIWNDPNIGIEWPNMTKEQDNNYFLDDGTPLMLSEKDKAWKCLSMRLCHEVVY